MTDGWMDIETAPKDGTHVVVRYRGEPVVAKWGLLWGRETWMASIPCNEEFNVRAWTELGPRYFHENLVDPGPDAWFPAQPPKEGSGR